jgi:hypothetical protein
MFKKIFVVLIALFGIGIGTSTFADGNKCLLTEGVEVIVTKDSQTVNSESGFVTFKNTNSYKVTVSYTIKFVDANNSSLSFEKTGKIVIAPNGSKKVDQSKYRDVDTDLTNVNMTVEVCD